MIETIQQMTKYCYLLLLFLFASSSAFAQLTYEGQVVDESGETLIGVNIIIKGTSSGTVTDFDGNYVITANPGDQLVFSYTGYTTEERTLGTETRINISLNSDSQVLEEVVVVGYGTQRNKDLTSSITTIKSEELVKTPTGQAMQALQGKVAGVQIVSSGAPGDSPTVRVRGVGSYPGGGNEAPLYVVDGMFFNNIDFLNTNDIASISVLKDASAAAIYGVRAANGVVLIETKSGGFSQKTSITYDGYIGTQVARNVLKLANAEQFTTMVRESGSEADISFIDNAMQRYGRSRINPNVPNVNTDWYDEILRDAPIENHSLNVSGGSDKVAYSIGGSYFTQDGILDAKNEYERFNLRTKLEFKANDWLKLGGNVIISNATRFDADDSAWFRAYFAVPILPAYDFADDGRTHPLGNAQDLGYRGGQNPLSATMFDENRSRARKLLANFFAQVDIIPGKLEFKSTYNNNYSNFETRNLDFPYFIGNGFQREVSAISRSTNNIVNQIWDNTLTYNEQFGKHKVTLLGGTSYRDESFEGLRARGIDFPVDQESAYYIDQALDVDPTGTGDGGSRAYGLSYFGRLSYSFNNKYLLYGTFRADGSNKYQEKWGYFPAVGAGWVVSEENFFSVPQIDFLKLRASWGQLGNDNIPANDGANTTSVVTVPIGGEPVPGTVTSRVFSFLEWEVVEETNVGLTSYLFDSRLSLDADYYTRDTKNAAIRVNVPTTGQTVLRNVGIIRNSGFELALGWNSTTSFGLSYNIGANIATLKNEVIDLFGQTHIDGGSAEFRQRSAVGGSLLAFYGREVAGVYQNQAEIDNDPVAIENNLEPGDFKYVDQNGDGLVNDDDRVFLGSYLPDLTYGFNLGASFKNFDVSASVFGQSGNKILNRKRGEVIFTSDTNIDADLAINRWHGEGTSDVYPSSKGLRKGWNQKLSDYFVEDGDFWRIQNVQIAYNLDGEKLFGAGFPQARISFTADRPLTVFDYNGFNPEVANGVDRQTYPIPAVYTFGLSLKL